VQGLRGLLLSTTARATHFAFIDALRGFAVLAVLLVHTGQNVAGLPAAVSTVTEMGAFGVHLFFVASAFTLFLSLTHRTRAEARPTLNYFLRRVFRIAPLFWLAIPFYLWWYGRGPQYWAPHGLRWTTVLATFCFAHGWHPTTINSVVPGGWSIAVEMSFYLLVPILFRWLTDLRRCVWFFAACVAGQWAVNVATQPLFLGMLADDEKYLAALMHTLWLPTQLPVFAAGFVLYFAVAPTLARRWGGADFAAPSADLSAGLGMLLAAAALAQIFVAPPSTFAGTVFAVLAGALALRPSRLFVNAATRYLGDISYSGYLVHFAVLDTAERVLRHFTPLARHPLSHLAVLYAGVVAGTVVVATITHRLVERPGRDAGRRLIAGLEQRVRVSA
jgi:peptidoglycan/LPS O-acetylase OafA/YrhL